MHDNGGKSYGEVDVIARSKPLVTLAIATCLALGPTTGTRAWDNAPWDALPFDQPNQLNAGARAKIARVEAEAMARTGAARGGKTNSRSSASALVTDGQRGCAVSLGTVALPQGVPGGTDVFTNVQIRGDVITVCR